MEMRAVHETIEGPFTIGEDLAVYGLITQGAVLQSGVKLILHGRSAATSPSNQARARSSTEPSRAAFTTKVAASRFSAWSMLSKISRMAR